MFREKTQKFSIRKLTIGAASVAIGASMANTVLNQKADAATVDGDSVNDVVKSDDTESDTATDKSISTKPKDNVFNVNTANTNSMGGGVRRLLKIA